MDQLIENTFITHTIPGALGSPFFNAFLSPDGQKDAKQKRTPSDGVRISLKDNVSAQIIDILKPTTNSVVIYPTFTSAAYNEPGFYTYFAGFCDVSCVTDISFENPTFEYTSSGLGAQILYYVGYDFLTDIQVDKNPELLTNYDTVILLHNEYVTKKQFDAISSHPNLIFLYPNALYAEVEVDYNTNSITLIRGHDYPPENPVSNGFDYEIEKQFHDYEYDSECLEWEFVEIDNGHHLNCYPEAFFVKNLDILAKMKEL